jgi:hypothetical protein
MATKDGVTNSIVSEDISMFPGFGPKALDESDYKNYKVRYAMIDIMDPGSRAELEIIETKAVKGEGIIVLTKDKYTFMDKFFIVVSYLELDIGNANTRR